MEAPDDRPYVDRGIENAIWTVRVRSWSSFFELTEQIFTQPFTAPSAYIWRGQRRADWSLSSTLDRQLASLQLQSLSIDELEEISRDHLERFKYAARGRRGPSPSPLTDDNAWWALGQHFGLSTPLLDWTRSPYAALYFAFAEPSDGQQVNRVVYGLNEKAVKAWCLHLSQSASYEKGRQPLVEIVDPLSDDNPRLVSQGGCFTRAPLGQDLESWIAREFEGYRYPILIRIELPDSDRLSCLQSLTRMNINHLSLFPDLTGASLSTNQALEFHFPKGDDHG